MQTTVQTNQKYHVPFDQIGCRDGGNCAVADNATGRRDHGQKRCKNSFRLLNLVEVDRGIDKSDQDKNTPKVGILEVSL